MLDNRCGSRRCFSRWTQCAIHVQFNPSNTIYEVVGYMSIWLYPLIWYPCLKFTTLRTSNCWRQLRPLNQQKLVSPIAKTIIKCKQSISGEHECKTFDKISKFCCVCCASNVHARVTLWLAVCDTDSSQRTSHHPQLPYTQPTVIHSYTNIFTQEDSTTQDVL